MEKDLSEIAKHLDNWKEVAPHLELTPINISDIEKIHHSEPSLQRCNHEMAIEKSTNNPWSL